MVEIIGDKTPAQKLRFVVWLTSVSIAVVSIYYLPALAISIIAFGSISGALRFGINYSLNYKGDKSHNNCRSDVAVLCGKCGDAYNKKTGYTIRPTR